MPAAKKETATDVKAAKAEEDRRPVDQQGETATDEKPMTADQALVAASKRSRQWATPVKQEKAAAESSKSDK